MNLELKPKSEDLIQNVHKICNPYEIQNKSSIQGVAEREAHNVALSRKTLNIFAIKCVKAIT